MSDTISRAKAIEVIDEIESEIAEGLGFEYEKWRKYFCDLPPAQPDVPDINVGDMISRQAAIDYFVINVGFHDEDGYPIEDTDELRKIWTEYFDGIPPAEPERIKGRWIAKEKKNLFRCSKCDAVIYSESEYDRNEFHKFCGRCGADMREVTK